MFFCEFSEIFTNSFFIKPRVDDASEWSTLCKCRGVRPNLSRGSQSRVQGNTKERQVTFVKRHASNVGRSDRDQP